MFFRRCGYIPGRRCGYIPGMFRLLCGRLRSELLIAVDCGGEKTKQNIDACLLPGLLHACCCYYSQSSCLNWGAACIHLKKNNNDDKRTLVQRWPAVALAHKLDSCLFWFRRLCEALQHNHKLADIAVSC